MLATQRLDEGCPILHAEIFVHFGYLVTQLVGITLAQAANYKQLLDISRLLCRNGFQDKFDALLLGVADKAAGVYHHHIGIQAVIIRRELVSCRLKLRHQMLAVNGILRATKCYDVDFFHTLLPLSEKGVYKVVTVEHPELVDALADTNIAHGDVELVADTDYHTTLGCAVQLGDCE